MVMQQRAHRFKVILVQLRLDIRGFPAEYKDAMPPIIIDYDNKIMFAD